jgi:hypothetical protein
MTFRLSVISLTALLLLMRTPCRAAEPSAAADLLPASTVFYLEIERPKDLIATVLDHPLRRRIEQSPDYRKALESPKYKEFQAVLGAVEQRSGVPWRKALEATTGNGVALAFDATTQGIVILSRAEDPATANKVRDALISLAREDAKNKGNPDPVQTKEYRGLTAYKAGDAVIGNLGSWMVMSNKPDLAKAVADKFLDAGNTAPAETLSRDVEFTRARATGNADAAKPTAWAFLRLERLRKMAGPNPLFDKTAKSEDAGAELILGGLVGPLRNAPYATASLTLDKQHLKLSVSSPNDPKWVSAERKFLFPPAGAGGGAAEPLRPKGTLLSVGVYRDLAGWWAAAPDLVSEGAAAKMAQTDSGLSAFLGGKSFGTDVLGALRPQIDFVAAAQDYKAAGVPEPTIKLPAFALTLRLKEKEAAAAQLRRHLRLGFQSIVALANLDGAAKGRPMLTMYNEKRAGADIMSAEYDAEMMMEAPAKGDAAKAKAKDKDGDAEGKSAASKAQQDIQFNFSPAMVISKDHLILCSTKQIAQEMADLAAKEGAPEQAPRIPQNALVEVSAGPVAELLRANRDQLVAKNVLEKGQTREQAQKEIDLLVNLVGAVRHAKLGLTPTDEKMTIELEVTTEPTK